MFGRDDRNDFDDMDEQDPQAAWFDQNTDSLGNCYSDADGGL